MGISCSLSCYCISGSSHIKSTYQILPGMQSQITANCMTEADFCKVAYRSFKALPVLQLRGRQPTV